MNGHFAWVLPLWLSGCMGIYGTKHTYRSTGQSQSVGGAEVRMAFRPEGAKPGAVMFSAMVVGAVVATMDGPFRWRVEAVGEAGTHEFLTVHRIRTRTEKTGRDSWYPSGELGRRSPFRGREDGSNRVIARYEIPGRLEVKPEEDGKLDVWLDVSVIQKHGASRKTLHLVLDPAVKEQNEMVFIPAEVIGNFGKPLDQQEDHMWD